MVATTLGGCPNAARLCLSQIKPRASPGWGDCGESPCSFVTDLNTIGASLAGHIGVQPSLLLSTLGGSSQAMTVVFLNGKRFLSVFVTHANNSKVMGIPGCVKSTTCGRAAIHGIGFTLVPVKPELVQLVASAEVG